MTNSNHDERIRFRHSPDSHLGQVITYMHLRGYDLNKETEDLLIARFLPFALREKSETSADVEAAKNMASDCIGKLTGFIYSIREAYQLQPLTTSFIPSTNFIPIPENEPEPEPELELKPKPKEPRNQIEDSFRRMFGD
ncbi:MAG: hypothetical protein LH679_21265 [Cyanobacteria bacterium CAN_BIN43]|nr:hypothetical protein [Cyanobacteria bacterium CAN_BIN43]